MITAFFALGFGLSHAQDEELSLNELLSLDIEVVTASKKAQKLFEAPSNITVITAQQIKEWGVRDMKDALKRVAGWVVTPDRDEYVFSVRGNVADNNQKYLILIDGVRMNSVENFGPGQIIELPNNLSMVQRIEVIRGPGSAVWGPDALAGVVNIITKNAENLDGNTVVSNVTVGQDGYYVGDFQLGEIVSPTTSLIIMGTVSKQDGREVLQSQSSGFGIATKNPDYGYSQYETVLDKSLPSYSLQAKAKAGHITLNSMVFSTDVYNRHYEYGSGRENYLSTMKTFVEAAYTDSLLGGQYSARLNNVWNHAEYRPYAQDTSTKLQTNISWSDKRSSALLDLQRSFLDSKLNLNGGMDFIYTVCGPNQRIDGINADSPTSTTVKTTTTIVNNDSLRALDSIKVSGNATGNGYFLDKYLEEVQTGAYLSIELRPWDKVSLTLASRIDKNENRGTDKFNVNPRAALLLFPFDGTTFKFLYNRGYLRPANFQSVAGTVNSETMDQFDAIVMQKIGNVSITGTAFYQRLEGFIYLLPGAFNFKNSATYESKGAELEVAANIGNHSVWVNGHVTQATAYDFDPLLAYNNRRLDLDENLLSYPQWSTSTGLTARFLNRALWVTPNLRLVAPTTYRVNSVASRELDADSNYVTTDIMKYLDISVGYDITKNWTVSMYMDNALDVTELVPQTVWNGGIEQYGRHVSGKLTAKF